MERNAKGKTIALVRGWEKEGIVLLGEAKKAM